MADEGFHEIQLGKKQLFFAFMAAALYSVVVFSLGVWVGQDVRRPDSEIAAAETSPDAPADATPEPTKISPNELDYQARLQSDGKGAAAPETKPVEPPPTPPDTAATTEVKTPPPVQPETKAAVPVQPPATKSAPAPAARTGGLTLQAGAFGDAKTAGGLATRLKNKGYAAYVFEAEAGPSRFKVRVGPLADKAESDKVMARLKKEEGLAPFPVPIR